MCKTTNKKAIEELKQTVDAYLLKTLERQSFVGSYSWDWKEKTINLPVKPKD